LLEATLAEYLLRPATEKDIPFIKGLIHDVRINPTGLEWRRFVVAETGNGKFAGCGQIKPHPDGSLELASIAVVSSERKQGLGSMIIRALLNEPSRPLYLTCRGQLGSFYQKFGFRIAGQDELSGYFRRIRRLADVVKAFQIIHDTMLVMVLE
jgi:N-acetylglutamate synthase-like GNAT family acetyltransferase